MGFKIPNLFPIDGEEENENQIESEVNKSSNKE